jgi:hypothetical protein
MTTKEAITAYLKLSKEVFAPKHRFNVIATLRDVVQAKLKCDSEVLRDKIKEIVAEKLGQDKEDALFLEDDCKCRV